MKNKKSKKIGWVLALFLGGIGVHLFYYQKYIRGLLYLAFCWTYVPILLGWIDMFFVPKWTRQLNGEPIPEKVINRQPIKEKVGIQPKEKTEGKMSGMMKSLIFYTEEDIILSKYSHIKTPKEIKQQLEQIRLPKKETYSDGGISYHVSYSSSHSDFVKDSLKYSQKRGVQCPEIPLMAYYTTFSHLDDKQKKWYFYWREQVLKGNYLEVDLSYIFMFVYELLNYTFNSKASFNLSMMERIYKNYNAHHPKLSNYIESWMSDMLYELGEIDLAKEWDRKQDYVPPLYKQIADKELDKSKVSITTWKPYVRNYRETAFFQVHKNKVYKTFKEGIVLLEEYYQEKGNDLVNAWFDVREERTIRNLFSGSVMGRDIQPIHVYVTRYQPTEKLIEEITTLFRISENVTRVLNNEKRQIKVEVGILPDDFQDKLLERFSKAAKKTNERFKVVQGKDNMEQGSSIPIPLAVEKENKKKPYEFDDERIVELNRDSEAFHGTIEKRGIVDSEEPNRTETLQQKPAAEKVIPENESNPTHLHENVIRGHGAQTNDVPSTSIFNDFLSGDGNEEEFIGALTPIEKDFLSSLQNGRVSNSEAQAFTKERGIMLGMFISDLNEKANEFLGDNIVEDQGEVIVIYEEYEGVLLIAKGS